MVHDVMHNSQPAGVRRRPDRSRRRRRYLVVGVFALAVFGVAGAVVTLARSTRSDVATTQAAAQPSVHPSTRLPVKPSSSPRASTAGDVRARKPTATLPAPIATFAGASPSRQISGPRDLRVPILMYHVIGSPPAGTPYPGLFVSKEAFVSQLRYLATHGYQAVTLRAVYDFWAGRGRLPQRPVVLSFDDGYRSHFTVVAPLLKELGWPGVLNLIVRNTRTGQDMRPAYVRAMVDAGWEIASHTVDHPDLTQLSSTELRNQLVRSRTALRRLFDVPVDFLCYPSGRYNDAVVAAVQAAGYLGAMTTVAGLAAPSQGLFTLHRVRVEGGENLAAFASSLTAP